jgi:hypothetical protein
LHEADDEASDAQLGDWQTGENRDRFVSNEAVARCAGTSSIHHRAPMAVRNRRSSSPRAKHRRRQGRKTRSQEVSGRIPARVRDALEHTEYDRTYKGECDIGGNNAQCSDEGTGEDHWETSLVHVAAHFNAGDSNPFQPEKVSPAVHPRVQRAELPVAWLKKREISALKSP